MVVRAGAILGHRRSLCQEVAETAQLVVGEDVKAFARRVTEARNLRTHLNTNRASEPALVLLQAQLAVILEAAILHRELGFEGNVIAERVARASRLYKLAVAASGQRPQIPE